MRRALLTRRSGVSYPVMLDNFEANDFASRWTSNSAFTRDSTSTPFPGSTASVYWNYGNSPGGAGSAYPDCIYLNGYTHARGEQVSVNVLPHNNNGNNGAYLLLHAQVGAGLVSPHQYPNYGYQIGVLADGLYFNEWSAGSLYGGRQNSWGQIPTNPFRLIGWVNPASHPSQPNYLCGEVRDLATNTLLISSYASTTYNYSDGWIGLAGVSAYKSSGNFWYDDVKIVGKT